MLTFEQVQAFMDRVRSQVPPIAIEFAAVADELRRCETKTLQVTSWIGTYWVQHLLYRGEWWIVGRTSLFDDVATGFCAREPADALTLAKLLARTQYGVRFHRWNEPDEYGVIGALSVIDHMTDG